MNETTEGNPYHFHKLRKARQVKNVRLCDIARALDLAESTICKVLRGTRFNEGTVFGVADFLGVPRETLIRAKRRAL